MWACAKLWAHYACVVSRMQNCFLVHYAQEKSCVILDLQFVSASVYSVWQPRRGVTDTLTRQITQIAVVPNER